MSNEIRVECSKCGEPSINPKDNPDKRTSNEELGFECSECGGMTFMPRERKLSLTDQVHVVEDPVDHSEVLQKIAEAKADIGYVAGALECTREDKYQEDLFQAIEDLKTAIELLGGREP